MNSQSQDRLLVKILIGVAWLDGQIQPEERRFLTRVLHAHQLDGDAEMHSMLDGTITLAATDCENWIQEYLGDRSIYDDDRLIDAISGLIYSDGDVATAEAKLLSDIQSVPTPVQPNERILLTKLRQLYQGWVKKLSS
jgi:uncharacterized tellurite resistance protein B-like protein